MLGIAAVKSWESIFFFSSDCKHQILSVNVILTRSNLVSIKNNSTCKCIETTQLDKEEEM